MDLLAKAPDRMYLANTRHGPIASIRDGDTEHFFRVGDPGGWVSLTRPRCLFARLLEIARQVGRLDGFGVAELHRDVLPPIEHPQSAGAVGVVYPASLEARIQEFLRGTLGHPDDIKLIPPEVIARLRTPYTVVGDPINECEAFSRGNVNHAFTTGGTMGFFGPTRLGHVTPPAADVPEPEVVVFMSGDRTAEMIGVGADMTRRRVEQESALLLGKAKLGRNTTGLSHQFCVPNPANGPIGPIEFSMKIIRGGKVAFNGSSSTGKLLRKIGELLDGVQALGPHPDGVHGFLGTNLVPPPEWSLEEGDEVTISSETLGVFLHATARKMETLNHDPSVLTF